MNIKVNKKMVERREEIAFIRRHKNYMPALLSINIQYKETAMCDNKFIAIFKLYR